MELTARPLITAGVALIGAGLITATPVAPAQPDTWETAVQLASEFDPITPWVQTLDTAFTNITGLGTALVTPPLPILQQVIVNQVGFLQDFVHNPSDIWNIFGQIWDNLVAGVSAPFEQPDLSALDGVQTLAYHALSGLMGTILPQDPELGQWVLDFSTTPLSGLLFGAVGTLLSPFIELSRSIDDITDAIRDNDWVGVLNDIVNVPAHMTDGFLNGAGAVDLTSLVQDLDIPVISIRSLSIDMPGLLSAGGTIFGSISGQICSFTIGSICGLPITMAGSDSGPLGSLIDLTHTIAQALGWDGTGNPLDALLTESTTTAGAVAGTDAVGTLWQDLLASVGL